MKKLCQFLMRSIGMNANSCQSIIEQAILLDMILVAREIFS